MCYVFRPLSWAKLLIVGMAVAVAIMMPNPSLAQAAAIHDSPFEETFSNLDPSLWYISNGWRNGEHQNCLWSRRAIGLAPGEGVRVSYLPPTAASPEALCGEFQSRGFFSYGAFEARLRADEGGSGLNAAFFTFVGPVHKHPHHEIDFEILRREPGLVWLNRYVDGSDFGAGEEYRYPQAAPSDLPEGYHDYAIVWEPERLRWFVDGILAREVTEHVPSLPMKLYFSLWGSDAFPAWMGRFAMPSGPVAMTVARFRYTPIAAGCSFEGSILCR